MKLGNILLWMTVIAWASCKSKPDDPGISFISKHKDIDLSKVKISFKLESDEPETIVWNGNPTNINIPDYGVNGIKWNISYQDTLSGSHIHSKMGRTDPVRYEFVFNKNPNSSIFVQIISRSSHGEVSSDRVTLRKEWNPEL